MTNEPVIRNTFYCLAHVPDLIPYGSKPRREIASNQKLRAEIMAAGRSYPEALSYPPNQTFIGNISPEELAEIPRPWFIQGHDQSLLETLRQGRFGEIINQSTFYGLLRRADILKPPLFSLQPGQQTALSSHPLFPEQPAENNHDNQSPLLTDQGRASLPLFDGEQLIASFQGDERAEGRDDENLAPHHLLENLCTKASAALALKGLLARAGMSAGDVDFVISCGEEACGDRYQRGGGGMAKAIAEMCGCSQASGLDIKNFCAAPASAIVMAAALVQSGVHARVVVVGGGSLAKLGMKFQAFIDHGMPILDDCLASMAFLITADDGKHPIIRLGPGAIGKVPVGAGTSDEAVFRHYLLGPLAALGLKLTDIDRFAPELQNPEIMEFAGSGDVAQKNYRKIAAMAVLARELTKEEMPAWIARVGMVGFAPTQGHIPSAVPYLGHALEAIKGHKLQRVMFLARASLFLNRCTNLMDGVSFILEANPGRGARPTKH